MTATCANRVNKESHTYRAVEDTLFFDAHRLRNFQEFPRKISIDFHTMAWRLQNTFVHCDTEVTKPRLVRSKSLDFLDSVVQRHQSELRSTNSSSFTLESNVNQVITPTLKLKQVTYQRNLRSDSIASTACSTPQNVNPRRRRCQRELSPSIKPGVLVDAPA